MMKKLLFGLYLVMATSVSFAQTNTHTVDISVSQTTEIESGDTVIYDPTTVIDLLDLGLTDVGVTLSLTCTSAPTGETASNYSQSTILSLGLITDLVNAILGSNPLAGILGLNDQVFTTIGEYDFQYTRLTVLGSLSTPSTFTIKVEADGTLSLKNVENTADFSVYSKDGVLTVDNTNANAVTGMAVYSISGAKVYESNRAEASINISNVANGVYILAVQEGASVKTKKFIKK